MTKKKYIGVAIALGIICLSLYLLSRTLVIGSGFVAKYVCSAHFVSRIPMERAQGGFNFFPLKQVSYTIDEQNQSASASYFSFLKKTAYFTDKGRYCSCTMDKPAPVSKFNWTFDQPTTKDSTDYYWPHGNILPKSHASNVDKERLDLILQEALDSNPAFMAITVAVDNDFLAEKYGFGVNRNTRLLGWSMTKTLANALYGSLAMEGKIDLDESDLLLEWKEDQRREITLRQLLQMNSGLAWKESYSTRSPITEMLYLEQDVVAYASSCELESPPGEVWEYSSGTSNILSGILRNKSANLNDYLAIPPKKLFERIGMRSAIIEMDASLNYILSSYCWATARDWTRFGLLYLNQGIWGNDTIFSKEWYDFSTTPAPGSNGQYGAHLWLNHPSKEYAGLLYFDQVPEDAFYENGFGGQRVLIIPSKKTVITILSDFDNGFDVNGLYGRILNCIQ